MNTTLSDAELQAFQELILLNDQPIGGSIRKLKGSIYESLIGLPEMICKNPYYVSTNQFTFKCPFQICLRSMRSNAKMKWTDIDVTRANKYIESNGISIYSHAPYTFNLCRSSYDPKAVSAMDNLVHELIIANRAGFKGVVIHVGKVCKLDESVAMDNKKRNLMYILRKYRSELESESIERIHPCRLLLETPAGQGTETLTTLEEFTDFCQPFIEKFSDIFGTCIDTCHIFACNYLPSEYIGGYIEKLDRSTIGLIHFNDSKKEKGSRVDRHHCYLRQGGHIGPIEMLNTAHLCMDLGLDMIVE